MSLIQEALRRQQEEMKADKESQQSSANPETSTKEASAKASENAKAAEPGIPPPPKMPSAPLPSDVPVPEAPEPPPPPVRRTSNEREHRVLGPLLGMLLVLVLLAGGLGWAVIWGYRLFTAAEEEPQRELTETVTEDPAPTTPDEPPVIEDEPEPPIVEAEVEERVPEPADTEEEVIVDVDVIDPATEEIPDTPPSPVVEDIAETPPPTEEPVADPPVEAPPPVIWPDLHISGVMGAGDSGSAIINGKVVGADETIGEVIVREFGRGYVVLEYQGETRRFSVGRSTR